MFAMANSILGALAFSLQKNLAFPSRCKQSGNVMDAIAMRGY